MPRRHDEQAFGSDSFLDIVANVVGILIILIIIVGVRVARSPVPTLALATAAPSPAAAELPTSPWSDPEPVLEESPPIIIDEPAPPPRRPREIVIEKPLPEQASPTAPPELVARADDLQQAIGELSTRQQRVEGELQAMLQRLSTAEATAAKRRVAATAAAAHEASERSELAAGERELAETIAQLQRLQLALAEADAEPAATAIQHRVTPIGRAVLGKELHFRLAEGKIAYVPVDELARRLRTHIERQKETFVKSARYEGAIDPIDGFRMQYVLERMSLSLADELKHGHNFVRMQVTQWLLLPEPDLESETPEQALRQGSRFYNSMLLAGPNSTLTLWVYPDSFEACRQVKDFAQRHGYDVATRPLPEGVPIAGSPDGSKSIAQ